MWSLNATDEGFCSFLVFFFQCICVFFGLSPSCCLHETTSNYIELLLCRPLMSYFFVCLLYLELVSEKTHTDLVIRGLPSEDPQLGGVPLER